MCYFDTFICCSRIVIVAIFIILHNYSAVLLHIVIIMHIRPLGLMLLLITSLYP